MKSNKIYTIPYSTPSKISKKKIDKIPKPSCPKIESYLLEEGNTTLKKLGQGTYGITFRGCYNVACSIRQGIKFTSLKNKHRDDETHPANIEVNIGKELSEFVNKKYTPNINRINDSMRCAINDLKKLNSIKSSEWLEETLELYRTNKIYPVINVYFMDVGTLDLSKFLKMRVEQKTIEFKEIIEILFQIFYTLSIIQYNIPHYRHNDLKPNNLIVRINNHNLDRDFQNYSICNQYNHAGTLFFIPHRGYTVKIIDYDFSYSKKYQNSKILLYKTSNFKYLGYGPFINPVFDLHFLLNSFYSSNTIMKRLPKFKLFIEKILPIECRGYQAKYVEKNKLTSYYVNKETNYIPKELLTPIEMIEFTNYFKHLKKKGALSIKNEYSSPYSIISINMRKRLDMFNVFKR